MPIETQKFIRKPLYVDAVRLSAKNFDDVVAWCQGEVLQEEVIDQGFTGKKYIKVRVHNPKNPRQTKAFVGDWLLYTERGYKVYTNKAFHASFNLVENGTPEAILQEITSAAEEAQDLPKFYIDPESNELTEHSPHKYAKPLGLPELVNLVRNEIVGAELQVAPEVYPHDDGDIVVLGPECFVSRDGSLLSWQGINYVPQRKRPTPANGDRHLNAVTTNGPVPPPSIVPPVKQQAPDKVVPAAAEGRRVLSSVEQNELHPDEVRELIQTGEAVLAQDIAQP